jgi:nickel transport protein
MRQNLALTLALMGTAWGLPVLAHGVEIEHRQVSSVELEARFETGEPMADAQVLVYAPDNPTEVWQKGTTDAQGRFSFVPDETKPGNWEVTVRQAGHGTIVNIRVSAEPAASGGGAAPAQAAEGEAPANSVVSPMTNLSPVQRGITIGAVIWGFIGTALFFARGKR